MDNGKATAEWSRVQTQEQGGLRLCVPSAGGEPLCALFPHPSIVESVFLLGLDIASGVNTVIKHLEDCLFIGSATHAANQKHPASIADVRAAQGMKGGGRLGREDVVLFPEG